jgi:hypothetical protein
MNDTKRRLSPERQQITLCASDTCTIIRLEINKYKSIPTLVRVKSNTLSCAPPLSCLLPFLLFLSRLAAPFKALEIGCLWVSRQKGQLELQPATALMKDASGWQLLFIHQEFLSKCNLREELTASVIEWSKFLATDPDIRVRFLELPDFLRSSGSGTGSTQPREYK